MTTKRTPDNIDTFVAEKMKEIRLSRGITQESFAGVLGISMQQVQKYENGVNRISASRLYQASRVLGVDVADFYEGVENTGLPAVRPYRDSEHDVCELVRMYQGIKDPGVRKSMLNLIRSVSKDR